MALAISAFTSATLLPGTSEAALLALLASAAASPAALLVVASIANVAGSCVNWLLGRFLMRYQDRKWFPASEAQIERAENWYRRWGWPSLLLAWLPVVGDPISVVAGILRTPFPLFLILVAVAKTGRYAAVIWLAAWF